MEKKILYHPQQPGYERAGRGYAVYAMPPGHPLEGLVSELFVLRDLGGLEMIQVVPDGCDDILVLFDQGRAHSYLSSSLAESHRFTFPAAKGLVGIRFQPGATANFLGEDMAQVAGQTLSMKDIWGDFGQVEERLAAGDLTQGIPGLTDYLLRKVRQDTEKQELAKYCVAQLVAAGGDYQVEALAQRMGYTSRYLRKLFSTYLGHGPKELAEILRVQRLLGVLREQPHRALGDVALLCGFADQSHMNRACRRYLGAPAGAIRSGAAWETGLVLPARRLFR